MNTQRELPAGPLLAALGGVLVLVALFLDWYDITEEEVSFTGWTSFETLDLVLAALALAAIAAALARFGLPRWVPSRALPLLGAAAFVTVATQLINHPPLFKFAEAELELGAWLAFIGSILMLVGGVISVARVSLALNVSDRAPGAAAPGAAAPSDVPPAPAAPPGAGTTPPHGDPVPPHAPGPDDQTQRLP